ncbi:hypothetical protein [Mycolicibacterium komossense]|nr:hypothetical protein [Mycolicibacterium komossense]
MDDDHLKATVIAAIRDTAVPRVDAAKLVEVYGKDRGELLAD